MAGPDYAKWIVAWICCFMTFVLLGVARLSGLLFVAVMDSYNVSRSEASLPFVLCYTIRNIAGPLIGYLGRRIGLKKVCLIGCVLSVVGIGLCFFAESSLTVTVLWGGVFGLGLGLSTVLIPEILRQHFTNDIAKANGIAFGGECLAGLVLPMLLEVSLRTYGTQGTFLILSGLVLNSIPAVLLLKKPSTIQISRSSSQDECINDNTSNTTGSSESNNKMSSQNGVESMKTTADSKFYTEVKNSAVSSKSQIGDFTRSDSRLEVEQKDGLGREICNSAGKLFEAVKNKQSPRSIHSKSSCNLNTNYNEYSLPIQRIYHSCDQVNSYCNQSEGSQVQKTYYFSNSPSSTTHSKCLFRSNNENSFHQVTETEATSSKVAKDSAVKSFAVFLDFTFILILLIQSFFIYIATTVLTVVVDFSKDIGVAEHEQIYIVMSMSIADMIGRFSLGFITDSGCMTQTAFSSSGFAIMGILLFISAWLRGFVLLLIVMFLFGLLIGGLLIVFPGIVSEHIESDKITMALASRLSLYGPLSLTQSPLIGFFRGTLGSYDGVFYILTVLCFLCSALTILTPFAAKRRRQRQQVSTTERDSLLNRSSAEH